MQRFCVVTACLLAGSGVQARTALAPEPPRESARLQLGDTGFHLVTEVRAVGLLKGTNIVAFSWKAVAVDGNSLTLTPITNANDVRLIGFTHPAGESGTLLAEVFAEKDVV